MAEPGEDSSPAMASPEAEMSGHESDEQRASRELAEKISKTGLDPVYWQPILQKRLGIVNVHSLKHIQPKDFSKLKEIQAPWQKRALYSLFNITEVEKTKTEKNEKAANILAQLKELMSNDKKQRTEVAKQNEKEMREALKVPAECSKLPERKLIDLKDYFDKQIGIIQGSYLNKENLTDEGIIKHASGGLALEGVFQTNNTEDAFKKREPVLCIPEGFRLVGPEQSSSFQQKEFTCMEEESHYRKTIEKLGLSVSVSLAVAYKAVGVKVDVGYAKDSESEDTSNRSSQKTSLCTARYNYIPLASCYFTQDILKLCPPVLNVLHDIEKFMDVESQEETLATKCAELFQRFGSHVYKGPIHFGGIFWWKAFMESIDTNQMEEAKRMTSEALNVYVGVSFDGKVVGFQGGVGFSKTDTQGSVDCSLKRELQKKVQLSIEKTGGPSEPDSLNQWKAGLVASNRTWGVIDRGNQLVPIWKIIEENHKEEFADPSKLALCLIRHYEAETGLTANTTAGEKLLLKEKDASTQDIPKGIAVTE